MVLAHDFRIPDNVSAGALGWETLVVYGYVSLKDRNMFPRGLNELQIHHVFYFMKS